MALTTLVPLSVSGAPGGATVFGAEPSAATDGFVAATADVQFPNDGRTLLFVRNSDAALTTVATVLPNKSINGVTYAASGATANVAAGKCGVFGPFPKSLNNSAGRIVLTVSNLTACKIAALKT